MGGLASILVVDDNPKFLADALPMYGYDVVVAQDGIEALKILTSNNENFDLILLDVMMPNMDGWDTLKAIRKNKKTEYIPVIMITAVSEEQKIVSGLKIGADDYIVKPFILPNLLARIEAVLRRSNWQKESPKKTKEINKDVNIDALTPKEKEVLALVAQGASNQEIADKLFVRDVTVKTHLNSIFKKLKVSNRTQAVLLAMEIDLIK
jgi:DNA-binding NarL/FixJ family response regulator